MNFDKLIDHFKLDKQEFYFQFNSHPNYPSALAFSDTLNFLGIKNDAYELDKEYWEELPDEYIALVDNSFSLVRKTGSQFTTYSDKTKNLSKEELYNNSGNFILLFEKTESLKSTSVFNFQPVIYFLFGVVILYSFLQFAWYESLFNILSLIGVYISMELFSQKFGNESVVVNNICGGASGNMAQSSCSKIFSSDKTDILGLKLSDFSLVYFIGIAFLGLIFPATQFILQITAAVSVAIIAYSLYLQAFVEKSLCRVCLVIISVLFLQILLSLVYFSWLPSLNIVFISIILFITLFFSIVFLNNLSKQKEDLKKSNAKNLRFKRNYELFRRELLDNEKIEFTNNQTFFLGNRNAKLHISIVSNPYCGFCKDAHKILEDLLERNPEDISAQIRFNYSQDRADEKYTRLISDFLNIYKNKSQPEFLKAVETWYETRNENEINKIAGAERSEAENLTNISQMTAENTNAGLTFTPVFILNGHQFPDKYDRDDIHYFINELLEDEDIVR